MERSIRDYVSEGANITYDQLIGRFGDPKQVAFTYVNEMETDEILENIRNSRKLMNIIAATAIIFGMLWLGYMTLSFFEVKNAANGLLVVGEVEVIERIEYDEGDN